MAPWVSDPGSSWVKVHRDESDVSRAGERQRN